MQDLHEGYLFDNPWLIVTVRPAWQLQSPAASEVSKYGLNGLRRVGGAVVYY